MESTRPSDVYQFGDCELDLDVHELRRNGIPRPIEPQVFDFLHYLIDNRDRLVSKDELNQHVWKGRFVSDSSLNTCVKLARQAIGDSGKMQIYIRTVPRRGFQFVGAVKAPTAAPLQTKTNYTLPEKPSIAVLPFDNLTGDAAQDYISDGLSETIIAVLSTLPDLIVTARNSSFTYKGQPVNVQDVAKTLGVRYILEGSVQLSGTTIRVTAQLIDAKDGVHLWADRYDRPFDDLFDMQDEITKKILEEIDVKLILGEQARRWHEVSGDLEIWRLNIQGRAHFQTFSPEGHKLAEKLWSEIYQRDKNSALGNSLMAWLHWQKVVLNLTKDPDKDTALARQYAERHVEVHTEPKFISYSLLATLDGYERRYESAIANADRAIELQPESGDAVGLAGLYKAVSGQTAEGVALMKRAMVLEPDYPEWLPYQLSYHLIELGECDEATNYCDGILSSNFRDIRGHTCALLHLAAMAIFQDDGDSARGYMARFLEIRPGMVATEIERQYSRKKNRDFAAQYITALRKAGLPA